MRAAALAAIFLLVGCPGDKPREICGNGIDDDGNGQIDCADIDCAGHDGCPPYDAGYFGPCPKCGTACTVQKDCIAGDWSSDQPLPDCVSGKCQALNAHVQLRLTLDMSAYAGLNIVSSEATHFVSKTARDGSAVSCATLTALAKPDAGALVIEERGTFSVLGFDSEPVSQTPVMLTFPFINTGTTDTDYLIWLELWSSGRDSNPPHEPTGRRFNPGCIETGAQVAPITTADDCAGTDAGTCRAISFTMPAPM